MLLVSDDVNSEHLLFAHSNVSVHASWGEHVVELEWHAKCRRWKHLIDEIASINQMATVCVANGHHDSRRSRRAIATACFSRQANECRLLRAYFIIRAKFNILIIERHKISFYTLNNFVYLHFVRQYLWWNEKRPIEINHFFLIRLQSKLATVCG